MNAKKKIPWYVRNSGLFISVLLMLCFAVGSFAAYLFIRLFHFHGMDAMELSMTACCLVSVAVGGIGGFLWLEKKSEETAV